MNNFKIKVFAIFIIINLLYFWPFYGCKCTDNSVKQYRSLHWMTKQKKGSRKKKTIKKKRKWIEYSREIQLTRKMFHRARKGNLLVFFFLFHLVILIRLVPKVNSEGVRPRPQAIFFFLSLNLFYRVLLLIYYYTCICNGGQEILRHFTTPHSPDFRLHAHNKLFFSFAHLLHAGKVKDFYFK